MTNSTNNKIIYIGLEPLLESINSSIIFDTMQSIASESIQVENCDTELQKQYMKLLSNQINN